jgi:pimeloyl-ACP methyl ester carboxylesterase
MRVIEAEYCKLDLDAVIRLIARFREFNITSCLPRIKAPTLVIASDLDTLKPVTYAERIHQQISQSELSVVKKAGHALTYEKPQEFNTLVLGFLAKQERAFTR